MSVLLVRENIKNWIILTTFTPPERTRYQTVLLNMNSLYFCAILDDPQRYCFAFQMIHSDAV